MDRQFAEDTAYGSIRRPLVSRTAWAGLTWPEFLDACQNWDEYLAIRYEEYLYESWRKGLTPEQAVAEIRPFSERYDEEL
jgi:hypothetical protein